MHSNEMCEAVSLCSHNFYFASIRAGDECRDLHEPESAGFSSSELWAAIHMSPNNG